jgi:hypothetical protein
MIEFKIACGKCKTFSGPSTPGLPIKWFLCGLCREILTPREVNKWGEKIKREEGECYGF